MPPPEVYVFDPRQIIRGPDEIRGQVGSVAFIFTKYSDPDGHHWFVQPGHVGHEEMTNTRGMLQALFGPDAERVLEQVVTIGDVYVQGEHGRYVPSGEKREYYDWHAIRRFAKQENLFGRAGTLGGRQVVMLWGAPHGWEAMLIEVLAHLAIGALSEVVVTVGNDRQYRARDFFLPLSE